MFSRRKEEVKQTFDLRTPVCGEAHEQNQQKSSRAVQRPASQSRASRGTWRRLLCPWAPLPRGQSVSAVSHTEPGVKGAREVGVSSSRGRCVLMWAGDSRTKSAWAYVLGWFPPGPRDTVAPYRSPRAIGCHSTFGPSESSFQDVT